MKIFKLLFIPVILVSFGLNLNASEIEKPIRKNFRIILVSSDTEFTKPEFVKTAIILKQRLKETEVKFKLTTTTNYEIKIVFKNKKDFAKVRDLIFSQGVISFNIVNNDPDVTKTLENNPEINKYIIKTEQDGMILFDCENFKKKEIDSTLKNNEYSKRSNLLFSWECKPQPDSKCRLYILNTESGLNNSHIVKTSTKRNSNTRQPEIRIKFNEDGTQLFSKLTKNNIDKNIAILVDGQVYTAPRVMAEISQGECIISGNFTEWEADMITIMLHFGKLPLKLKLKDLSN
jgi:preprotein translocase subunit SecD